MAPTAPTPAGGTPASDHGPRCRRATRRCGYADSGARQLRLRPLRRIRAPRLRERAPSDEFASDAECRTSGGLRVIPLPQAARCCRKGRTESIHFVGTRLRRDPAVLDPSACDRWPRRRHPGAPSDREALRGRHGRNPNHWASIVTTRAEHQAFTNAWRGAIPYGAGTRAATRAQVESAARRSYADYPEILRALGLP